MAEMADVQITTHTDRWWLTLCGECGLPLSVGVFSSGRRCFKCGATARREVHVIEEGVVAEALAGIANRLDDLASQASVGHPNDPDEYEDLARQLLTAASSLLRRQGHDRPGPLDGGVVALGEATLAFRNSSNGYYGGWAGRGEDGDRWNWREIEENDWSA